MDIHDGINKVYREFFLNTQTVNSETEGKKTKDDESDEEVTDRSQTKFLPLQEEV